VEQRLRTALDDTTSGDAGNAGDAADEFQIVRITLKSILRDVFALRCNVFLIFLRMSRTKRLVLNPFLDSCLPEMTSNFEFSRETSMKKSKNIAQYSSSRLVYARRSFSSKTRVSLRETPIL